MFWFPNACQRRVERVARSHDLLHELERLLPGDRIQCKHSLGSSRGSVRPEADVSDDRRSEMVWFCQCSCSLPRQKYSKYAQRHASARRAC